MHEVSSINGQEGKQFLMKMSSFMIGGLAVDANADKIYFIDSKSDSIKELNMMTGQVGTLTYVSSGSGNRIHIFMPRDRRSEGILLLSCLSFCHSVILQFCHSVFLSETLTLLITYEQ